MVGQQIFEMPSAVSKSRSALERFQADWNPAGIIAFVIVRLVRAMVENA
jgi:hypothetical protein